MKSNGDTELGWRIGYCPVKSSPVGCRDSWEAYWSRQLSGVWLTAAALCLTPEVLSR